MIRMFQARPHATCTLCNRLPGVLLLRVLTSVTLTCLCFCLGEGAPGGSWKGGAAAVAGAAASIVAGRGLQGLGILWGLLAAVYWLLLRPASRCCWGLLLGLLLGGGSRGYGMRPVDVCVALGWLPVTCGVVLEISWVAPEVLPGRSWGTPGGCCGEEGGIAIG